MDKCKCIILTAMKAVASKLYNDTINVIVTSSENKYIEIVVEERTGIFDDEEIKEIEDSLESFKPYLKYVSLA